MKIRALPVQASRGRLTMIRGHDGPVVSLCVVCGRDIDQRRPLTWVVCSLRCALLNTGEAEDLAFDLRFNASFQFNNQV